jgi:hypothetical protein
MRWFSQTSVLLLALLTVAGAAHAQDGSPSMQGNFTLDPAASGDVSQAIDRAVARMNMMKRPIARSRLKKTNEPYQQVTIAQTPSEVTFTADDRTPVVAPPNGTPIKWTREDGEVFDVTTQWKDDKLEQTFKAEDGQRVNTFTLSPDGNVLTMDVRVTSPRLSRPLFYTLVFRRT